MHPEMHKLWNYPHGGDERSTHPSVAEKSELQPPLRWRVSNRRRVGRGSKGCEAPLVDGMVPRKGSAKAPFGGLDEIVSMRWSWGYRGQQERSPDW
jgi:hypothetical protein